MVSSSGLGTGKTTGKINATFQRNGLFIVCISTSSFILQSNGCNAWSRYRYSYETRTIVVETKPGETS